MSVTASMILHVGGILLFVHISQIGTKAKSVDIQNVDIIRVFKPTPVPQVKVKAPPPTIKDFLKMALPAVHRPQLMTMQAKLPEIPRPLLQATPKLEDRTRLQQAKLEALDLNKRRVDAARIDAKLEERHTTALAALPRLEDVGRRQVRNLPAALKLEEQRQEAMAFKSIQGMEVSPSRHNVAPAAVLQEATPQQSGRLERITSFLPTAAEPVQLQPRAAAPPPMIKKIEVAPVSPKRTAAVQQEKRKAVEIEGPLADRKVVSYDVPQFPDWAKQRNILEAEVVVLFYVDPDGNVISDMHVEHTSGYGQLDRLSMDSLRNWKFVPISSSERQWGRITFRFILE